MALGARIKTCRVGHRDQTRRMPRLRGDPIETNSRNGWRMTMLTSDYWIPYAPGEKAPWNLRRVVHLHRRAGFAATWSEIRRDLKDGPQASIDRLLNGKARESVPADFERVAGLLADAAVSAGDPARLK